MNTNKIKIDQQNINIPNQTENEVSGLNKLNHGGLYLTGVFLRGSDGVTTDFCGSLRLGNDPGFKVKPVPKMQIQICCL